MRLTQVTTVKGRAASVKANIKRWLKTDIDQLVLVDFDCPDKTGLKLIDSDLGKDPRLDVLLVGTEVAGPFYNHGRARNMGVQAAKHELILFLDADSHASVSCVADIKERFVDDSKPPVDIYGAAQAHPKSSMYRTLPFTWTQDGQFVVRNATIIALNGFSEEAPTWGGESYDFQLRAYEAGYKLEPFVSYMRPAHKAHEDEFRDQYLPKKFDTGTASRKAAFLESMRLYGEARKISTRAQPGRRMGLPEPHPAVKLVRNQNPYAFRPGED